MIAQHVGRETTLSALGQNWTVGRLTRRDWADWLEWAKPRIPDPLDVLSRNLDKFPAHLHDGLIRHAVGLASEYLSIGSREVHRCLTSLEGSTRLLWQLMRKHHPTIDEDTVFEIAMEVGAEVLQASIDKASGKAPASGNAEAEPDIG